MVRYTHIGCIVKFFKVLHNHSSILQNTAVEVKIKCKMHVNCVAGNATLQKLKVHVTIQHSAVDC